MTKYCLFICLFLFTLGCTPPNSDKKDINTFLKDWAQSLTQKDAKLRRFYDPAFAFPDVLVNDAANLKYSINLDSVEISNKKHASEILVQVPFTLHDPIRESESAKFQLTIIETENGFYIKDMSQELTREVVWRNRISQYDKELAQRMKTYDSIWASVRKTALQLQQHYDTVVFFTEVNDNVLFYVANGAWVYPYPYDGEQSDGGKYKMGVVTADCKVVVPVEYNKIYNPGGTIPGLIEVELNGLRGLYSVKGEQIIPAEYQGIFPTNAPGAIAQLKKDSVYGWLSEKGQVSFDAGSHKDKSLFISPIESKSVLSWQFKYPGEIDVLIDMNGDSEECAGIIIYPSFIRDLGITDVAHPWVLNDVNELGMGMTDTEIKFEHAESLSDKLFGLVSFFMESGADARGYQFSENDLMILDNSMTKIDHLENLISNSFQQDPCGNLRTGPAYKVIDKGLFEANDGHGNYKYFKVNDYGKVEQQLTDRKYAFTKFVKISDEYFNGCRYEGIPYEDKAYEKTNIVVITGLSVDDLDVMRNEIFAEYGFIFKSPKWKQYFEKQPWYKPRFDNVDDQLTEIDKYNIKFILDYQRQFQNKKYKRDSIQFYWAG
jgi:hypothetical protein